MMLFPVAIHVARWLRVMLSERPRIRSVHVLAVNALARLGANRAPSTLSTVTIVPPAALCWRRPTEAEERSKPIKTVGRIIGAVILIALFMAIVVFLARQGF